MKKRHVFRTISAVSAALLLAAGGLVSCNGSRGLAPRPASGTGMHYYDSIICEEIEVNPKRVVELVDSLEDTRSFPEIKANYYRAQAYYKMKQELTAELYYKKALAGYDLWEQHPAGFYFASDQLSTILTCKGDHEGALAVAMKGYASARKDDGPTGSLWSAALLHDIGYCQMALGRAEEAEKSFVQAYSTLQELVAYDGNYYNLYTWARVSYNIVDAYTSNEFYDKASEWIPRAEEAVRTMVASQKCPPMMVEEYQGGLSTHKAIVLLHTGQKAAAEEIYRQFIHSDYANTNIGLIDIAEYLNRAERWDELADNVPRLDSLAKAWENPMSMYYMKEYLILYLKAYLKAGRKEQALQVAETIVESIDSVADYERQHNAAELAIIYETQEKEAKIAEQQASIRTQRLYYTAGALLLMLLFLSVFMVHRYRAAKRLEEKNRELEETNAELVIANERAEESSRMKTDFIQQISHEIRTPLNILSGFAQVLTMPGMEMSDSEKEDIAKHMSENTDRITGLVNKMLELADASSQTVLECGDRVPAVQVAVQAVDDSNICKASHLTFEMEKDAEAETAIVTTNLRYAIRALSLLLDNAQKFTHPAESYVAAGNVEQKPERVWLKVSVADKEVRFAVEDTGIGVPAAEAEHIFDKFVQLDEYYDGTGIGLTVARSIARRLGGNITLDTAYTKGARFVFSLPLGIQNV